MLVDSKKEANAAGVRVTDFYPPLFAIGTDDPLVYEVPPELVQQAMDEPVPDTGLDVEALTPPKIKRERGAMDMTSPLKARRTE